MIKQALKKLSFLAIIVVAVISASSSSTNALSGSEFNAGRIVDDAVFFNSNSMSVSDIQTFLNNKVACDTSGAKMVGGITRAQYAANRGWPTTFTCLPQYKENPTTHENNIGNPGYAPPGAHSAAQIIYNVSASYGVSSKALIVLLQKEQGLVTDEWPVPRQYQIATGYGCPDTAPCNDQYYGFMNQVTKAAYQFKRYVNNSSGYRYKAGKVNSVLWSPNTSCGATNVFIENGATAALYNYTPYRPNTAALNNLYGSGDGCSAYDNRNFWRYFRDWFGSVNFNLPGPYPELTPGLKYVYRAYNPKTNRHFWTNDVNERNSTIINLGFSEGAPAFITVDCSVSGSIPVYRAYNPVRETHFWTSDVNEFNAVESNLGFRKEGLAYCSSPAGPNSKPVWRLYDRKKERHFWTSDVNERNFVVQNLGFTLVGVAYYIPN